MASSSTPRVPEANGSTSTHPAPVHPFAHSKNLLTVIRSGVDVEEESQFYDEFLSENEDDRTSQRGRALSGTSSPPDSRSLLSNDIWLGDNSGESRIFARDIKIPGWTKVGDKRGGAYIVYDCVIMTKEGSAIHALKRYTAFEQLHTSLMLSLPRAVCRNIPPLPPKATLAKYRPAFLDRRRRKLEHWLSVVLFHPDIGGRQVVRNWVIES